MMEYSDKRGLGNMMVEDVYDLAAEIGKEFEVIIDTYGLDVVSNLMPKVIYTLEHLEACAVKGDDTNEEVTQLMSTIAKLETDKHERAEFRNKFEKELEQIEDNWRKEASQLSDLVSRLQEENQRLGGLLAEKNYASQSTKVECATDDVKIAQKLKEMIDKQRDQIHSRDKELLQRTADIDSLQQQTDRLSQLNSEHCRRLKHLQCQMRNLVEEKSELQAQVQDQQRELQAIHKKLSTAIKENTDLVKAESQPNPDMRRMLVIDPDDPNRPRFTLEELRNILFEKNDLKARVSELEDELSLYRPARSGDDALRYFRAEQQPSREEDPGSSSTEEEEEDLPVQGPINREPDDKLFPSKKTLGIRRFFPAISWIPLKALQRLEAKVNTPPAPTIPPEKECNAGGRKTLGGGNL